MCFSIKFPINLKRLSGYAMSADSKLKRGVPFLEEGVLENFIFVQLEGKEDFFLKLLGLLEGNLRSFQAIGYTGEKENREEIGGLAHKVSSGVRAFGAISFGNRLAALELSSKIEIVDIGLEYRRVIEEIEPTLTAIREVSTEIFQRRSPVLHKVLVVEDSLEVQKLIELSLRSHFEILLATSSEEAEHIMKSKNIDLVILDIGLPGTDGFVFYSNLKASEGNKTPMVFFLSARDSVEDKVRAFSLGADDYLVKPFNPRELLARVTAKIHKLETDREAQTALLKKEIVQFGRFSLSPSFQQIAVDYGDKQEKIGLTSLEFRLFYHFLKNENQTFSRGDLLKAVWGPQVSVSNRTIDTHIYFLRKKLGKFSCFLKSVSGIGYRFSQMESQKNAS